MGERGTLKMGECYSPVQAAIVIRCDRTILGRPYHLGATTRVAPTISILFFIHNLFGEIGLLF